MAIVNGYDFIDEMYASVERGETNVIEGYRIRQMKWHNPDKGETMLDQIERWRDFIHKAYRITSLYDPIKDIYLFKKIDN